MVLRWFLWATLFTAVGVPTAAQESATPDETTRPAAEDAAPKAPTQVEVRLVARDEEIRERLQKILEATGWFSDPQVNVAEGVVFLDGVASRERYRIWATDLAQNTRDAVAVVNRIDVRVPSPWNFEQALIGLRALQRDAIHSLPFVVLGVSILLLACIAAIGVTRLLRPLFARRIAVPLLREVLARALGLLVFLFGLYLVLKVSGLTRLALTVLGGTGLAGLVIGIAFRDITENFLASILLSMQRPFRAGDLVEIEGSLGYVQQLNVRTTVLMTLTGNHVQIPNATVYKAKLTNYTSNANRREDFLIGIGYDVLIPTAQQVTLQVLSQHPAVLREPEPWVLVDGLGPATVNLRVYFWIDGNQHSWLKVKSSLIRLVKRAFQEEGISMPDEAREIVFPAGVTVHLVRDQQLRDDRNGGPAAGEPAATAPHAEDASLAAEGGLQSDAKEIEKQAKAARVPEGGEDLLQPETN